MDIFSQQLEDLRCRMVDDAGRQHCVLQSFEVALRDLDTGLMDHVEAIIQNRDFRQRDVVARLVEAIAPHTPTNTGTALPGDHDGMPKIARRAAS